MFGEWLRQQRESRRLTRKEFAQRIGCSVSALQKIEYGERRPSAQIAELIAASLDLPAADRATFIKVARGALSVERLAPASSPAAGPKISSPISSLPALTTPLIGRQREVEKLSGLLRDPQCRLLTLVGPGGIGKTRLAIETASQVQDAFSDGVHFVSLAPASSISYIVPMIAQAVGFSFQSIRTVDPKTQLFNFLEEKQALFLTDNLEHLLTQPGIELLAELLGAGPQIKLLATSRESLGLQGEWIYEVPGLPVPKAPQDGERVHDTAVELFIQTAARARVGFSPTPEDFSAILRVCRLVEGIPLAIELAAAWVRTVSCDEIAQQIERGLDFLSTSARATPARHRSMRAVCEHSWRLLSEAEQQVLARLSVFRGGFRRDAAEKIAEATLPMLSALVTKSLIRRGGAGRYDLHELIRQYAVDRLAERPKAWREAQKLHALYYLEYFGRRDTFLRSATQHETMTELSAEMDNLRVAWDWSIAHHEVSGMYEAANTIWYFCELQTWFEEGELIFAKAAQTFRSHAPGTDIADQMDGFSAYLAYRQGDTVSAYDKLSLVSAGLPSSARMYINLFLGIVCRDLGKFLEANEVLWDSLGSAEGWGDEWLQSMAEQFLGIIALETGDYELARHHLMRALKVGRKIGDPMLIAHALSFVSLTNQYVGEFAGAERYLQESLTLAQTIGYRWGIGHALDGLGVLAQKSDLNEARKLFAAGSDIYREIGDLRSLARVLCHQGLNSLALGDLPDAQESFTEALKLGRQCSYMPYMLEALAGFASLETRQGNLQGAFELVSLVLNHPVSIQMTRERALSLRAELEGQLGPALSDSIRARAGEKTIESIVESILL